MRLLLYLLYPALVFSLQCFSTKLGNTVETDVCILELNLYNLGCLPAPSRLGLYDLETAYATVTANGTVNETRICRLNDHYATCYCDWDHCNRDWKELNKQMIDFQLETKVVKCIKKECKTGYDCYSFGTKEAKEFHHDDYTQNNKATLKEKKTSVEAIILCLAGGVLFSFILGVVIYACIYECKRKRKEQTLLEHLQKTLQAGTAPTASTSSAQPLIKKEQ